MPLQAPHHQPLPRFSPRDRHCRNDVCVLVNLFSSGCFCSETSSVSSTSASSSRSISSGSLVSKRSCSGSGITSVGPDEELMSSCFQVFLRYLFVFVNFSGSVSEVSAAVGSFFFVLRAVFLVTVVVFICLTLKLTLVSLCGVDYLVNFFSLASSVS